VQSLIPDAIKCLCANNPVLTMNLYIPPGRSWLRVAQLTMRGTLLPYGGPGYAAELIVSNRIVASVANGRCNWAQTGQLVIGLTQADTLLLAADNQAIWRLDVLDPNLTFDPQGFRQTMLEGVLFTQAEPVSQYTACI
jgi:hypothetical protein